MWSTWMEQLIFQIPKKEADELRRLGVIIVPQLLKNKQYGFGYCSEYSYHD
jgi:hypothetical protein